MWGLLRLAPTRARFISTFLPSSAARSYDSASYKFAWSAGDIAFSIKIIYRICKTFKEVGGASDKYAETVAFLEGFTITPYEA